MASLKPYEVTSSGSCSTCNTQAHESEILKCRECQTNFHVICGDDAPYCCRTFLSNFKKLRVSNFLFVCDSCVTRREHNQASDLKDQISELAATVGALAREFNSFKTEKVQELPEEADTVWKNKDRVQEMKTSLCIKGNNGVPVDLKKVQEIATANCIQVTKADVKPNGDVFVDLPSQENRQKLIPLLDSDTFEQNEVVTLKHKLPTITILGVKDFTSKEDFRERLKKQNPQLEGKLDQESDFSIVYCRKPRDHEENRGHQVVARVSEEVRKIIKNGNNRIYMDLLALKVVDRFYIIRCNKCQKFGHYEQDCSSRKGCCGFCTQEHKSEDCDQVEEGDL